MNLTGGTTFSGELRFKLENYFPEAHYKKAIDKAFEKMADDELRSDGGSRYYWIGEDGTVYHNETEDEMVNLFSSTVDEAEHYLENLAEVNGRKGIREWFSVKPVTRKSRNQQRS